MLEALKKYAIFTDRARRKEYWLFVLFTVIVAGLSKTLDYIFFSSDLPIIYLSTFFLLLIPRIAVTIRRLHDTNRTGWWLLLILIPVIGWITCLVFFCQKGTQGSNKYGEDPLENDNSEQTTKAKSN